MTYSRLFERVAYTEEELQIFRLDNFRPLVVGDRIRCQKCNGYHFRLWFDMAQCCYCKMYTMIELGIPYDGSLGDVGKENEYVTRPTFLQVPWIKAQLSDEKGINFDKRIEHPVTHKKEFIVYDDRLRCRVTGDEIMLDEKITGYWAIDEIPLVTKLLTGEDALKLVNEFKDEAQ